MGAGLRAGGWAPSFPVATLQTRNARPMMTYLRTLRDERRQLGWRGLLRKRGWKLVVVFVAYYLVRDTVLYIIIPVAIAAGVLKR